MKLNSCFTLFTNNNNNNNLSYCPNIIVIIINYGISEYFCCLWGEEFDCWSGTITLEDDCIVSDIEGDEGLEGSDDDDGDDAAADDVELPWLPPKLIPKRLLNHAIPSSADSLTAAIRAASFTSGFAVVWDTEVSSSSSSSGFSVVVL